MALVPAVRSRAVGLTVRCTGVGAGARACGARAVARNRCGPGRSRPAAISRPRPTGATTVGRAAADRPRGHAVRRGGRACTTAAPTQEERCHCAWATRLPPSSSDRSSSPTSRSHAEQAGFDSVFISDHLQPWRHDGGHAPGRAAVARRARRADRAGAARHVGADADVPLPPGRHRAGLRHPRRAVPGPGDPRRRLRRVAQRGAARARRGRTARSGSPGSRRPCS